MAIHRCRLWQHRDNPTMPPELVGSFKSRAEALRALDEAFERGWLTLLPVNKFLPTYSLVLENWEEVEILRKTNHYIAPKYRVKVSKLGASAHQLMRIK